jgi:hypothetical protein
VNSDTSHTVCAHFYFICIVLLYLCHLVFVLLKHIQIVFDIANHFPKYVLLVCCQRARYTNNLNSDKANDAPLKMKLTASLSAFKTYLVMYSVITTAGIVHATPTEKRVCGLPGCAAVLPVGPHVREISPTLYFTENAGDVA